MDQGNRTPRVAVAMILMQGDAILLVQRRHHGNGSWCAPGGYLDHGEELAAGAAREVIEETGVEPLEPAFLCVSNDRFPDGRHNVTVWFSAVCASGVSPDPSSDEILAAEWFPPSALPSPLYPSTAEVLCGRTLPREAVSRIAPGAACPERE